MSSTQTPHGEARGRFEDRFSALIVVGGITPVPTYLLRYQARLGLSHQELTYLLHVLSHRRDGATWPWVSVASVVEACGASERNVRLWKQSLERKGYLVCRARRLPSGGRAADEHDLSRLFAALEALILEDESRKALDRVRADLPAASYHRNRAPVPQLSTGGPGRLDRGPVSQSTGGRRPKSAGGLAPDSPGAPVSNPAGERETKRRDRTHETRRSTRLREADPATGLAALRPEFSAASPDTDDTPTGEPPGLERLPAPSLYARPEGVIRPLDATERAALATRLTLDAASRAPGSDARRAGEGAEELALAYDEGSLAYIEEYAPVFTDNDPARSVEVAHHLWWNSRLPRWAFHNAMKAAAHATAQRVRTGQLRGRPMAYFFTLLRAAVEDQRLRQAGASARAS
jgi:hypothetical protein